MQIKRTIQGEAWDMLAKKEYGSEYDMQALLETNPAFVDTLLFSGNKEINMPDKAKATIKIPATWE